ncbi:PAS domain S-box-containing protein/diguanylate cyclase (GGDEF)-like protein [Pseudidiomarina maritima]|uniref:PAS domain S-box-containing protein/diguanylate cyclase (GGDEF)-like protein n=2 Tax=Pseudidiomarina TaxID=2800384 RepID=A0A317QCD1_9GAMM|nr:PAS domain S-box-containing protein/diguanylate cyclase (GGDEF)-like protein [Pseudidiomarina maritima]RBP91624.1 PAS domain S-box-containing protein/diguanylate cyclase (GGDEF)-like protein [Pseudidiomarina tainanensis]
MVIYGVIISSLGISSLPDQGLHVTTKDQGKSPPPYTNALSLLSRRVIIGVLMTGIIASISTLIPLFFYLDKTEDRQDLAYASAQALAVEQQLTHYEQIAQQFASRSQIRQRLALYLDQQLALAQVQQETAARLAHAVEFIPTLVGVIRIAANGTEIARVAGESGTTSLLKQVNLSQLNLHRTDYINLSGHIYISVVAPIISLNNEIIGHDVLLFDQTEIIDILEYLNKFDATTEFSLLHLTRKVELHFSLSPIATAAATEFNANVRELIHSEAVSVAHALVGQQPQLHSGVFHNLQHRHFYIPLSESNWGLWVTQPETSLREELLVELLWVSGIIFLIVAIGAYLLKLYMRPIIQQQQQQQQQLQALNRQLQLAGMVFEKTHEAIVITDVDLRIKRANQAFLNLLNLSSTEIKQHSLSDFIDSNKGSLRLTETVRKHLQQQDGWQGEIWYRTAKGEPIAALQTITAVRNQERTVTQLIHIFNDVTADQLAVENIKQQALTDPLTGLPNRAAINHQITVLLHNAPTHLAVLFLDLDKFKPINDTYGHDVGDQLLRCIGPRIKAQLRHHDVVARIGGDEFVIVLNALTEPKDAEAIAQKLVLALQQPFVLEQHTVTVGASVGIALYPEHGQDYETLLNKADNAMYRAKESGRNRYCVAE